MKDSVVAAVRRGTHGVCATRRLGFSAATEAGRIGSAPVEADRRAAGAMGSVGSGAARGQWVGNMGRQRVGWRQLACDLRRAGPTA
ncbi:MAG: hypothetical protein HYZ20_10215 [Burkholderiales bacterium]|nr:hypothetical protein [Burkholderiales bacterium]